VTSFLRRQLMVRTVVVVSYCSTCHGKAAVRVIATRCADYPYRKVERADSSDDSYKTTHVGLILSVRLQLM
jgi:hypothetical protein